MLELENQKNLVEFFDRCARKGCMADFSPEERAKIPRLLELWDILPGQRVLEPGCGSGRLTVFLAEAAGPDGEVLALDLSPEMARRAARRVRNRNTTVARGSVYAIPAENARFDHVICFCVFPHLTQRQAALREMTRVLKPEGSLWINHFVSRATLNAFHRDSESAVARHVLPPEDEMRRLISEAGFRIVRCLDSVEEGYCLHAVRET